VVAAVIEVDGRFLVTRRQKGVHLEGLWEFPGGKVDEGESHAEALIREIREELAATATPGELVLHTSHEYPDRTVHLHFYRCHIEGTPSPQLGQQMEWVPRTALAALDFPPADDEVIACLTR
jgi:mutator protein MutT